MSVKNLKKSIREEIIAKRDSLTEDYRDKASKVIRNKLINSKEFHEANTIMSFVSFSTEVDTREMMELAWSLNKKIVTPLAILKDRKLELYHISKWDQLKEGIYGILEPMPDEQRVVKAGEVDLVIYPGVAFDEELNRLGYGAGFYDRFYHRLKQDCYRVAIAFDMQIISKVPTNQYDVPVQKIITEKKVLEKS